MADKTEGKTARPQWNGDALREHRKARNWEVEELADVLGADKSQVYKWENGDGMPKADWFAAILIVFDAPALRFFSGIDEFQKGLKGRALVKQGKPIIVEGQDTGVEYFSTDAGGGTAPRAAAPKSDLKPLPAAAKPTSAPTRARRSRKPRS